MQRQELVTFAATANDSLTGGGLQGAPPLRRQPGLRYRPQTAPAALLRQRPAHCGAAEKMPWPALPTLKFACGQ